MADSRDQKKTQRPIPISELDLNLLLTNTEWGGQYIPPELKAKLTRVTVTPELDDEGKLQQNEDGSVKAEIKREDLWELLGFFTRDMRLANINDSQFRHCNYYLNLANDYLRTDRIQPFLITLSRAVSILELSQSRGGFLRRRMNTITSENYQTQLDAKKKNFFGGSQNTEKMGGN